MTAPQTPVLEIPIPLTIPVPVTSEDGKQAKRDLIVMTRPRARHAKQLAVIIGADLARLLVSSDAVGDDGKLAVPVEQIVSDLATTLLSKDRLDAVTGIVADLCGEAPALIDDLDLADLISVLKAFAGFFPSLQSLVTPTPPPG